MAKKEAVESCKKKARVGTRKRVAVSDDAVSSDSSLDAAPSMSSASLLASPSYKQDAVELSSSSDMEQHRLVHVLLKLH